MDPVTKEIEVMILSGKDLPRQQAGLSSIGSFGVNQVFESRAIKGLSMKVEEAFKG